MDVPAHTRSLWLCAYQPLWLCAYEQMLMEAGSEPTPDSRPEKFRRMLADDVALWTPVVKAPGVS
jgi:hypothetical protein